jgi:hypothetical protein
MPDVGEGAFYAPGRLAARLRLPLLDAADPRCARATRRSRARGSGVRAGRPLRICAVPRERRRLSLRGVGARGARSASNALGASAYHSPVWPAWAGRTPSRGAQSPAATSPAPWPRIRLRRQTRVALRGRAGLPACRRLAYGRRAGLSGRTDGDRGGAVPVITALLPDAGGPRARVASPPLPPSGRAARSPSRRATAAGATSTRRSASSRSAAFRPSASTVFATSGAADARRGRARLAEILESESERAGPPRDPDRHSFGADVPPFAWNRLPALARAGRRSRCSVRSHAVFEFHLSVGSSVRFDGPSCVRSSCA